MKRTIFLITLILIAAASLRQPINALADSQQVQQGQSSSQPMLASTIQIIMYREGDNGKYWPARGLGTITELNGETVIYTHNHWGDMLNQMDFVQMTDANQNLLLELTPTAYRALIGYQNAGIMILNLPHNWPTTAPLTPAPLGSSNGLQLGQTVAISYRIGEHRDQVGILLAKVEGIERQQGLPAVVLRSLDGTPILTGDSGGGIWLNGELVATMWATELDPQSGSHTDTSIAALHPDQATISSAAQETEDVIIALKLGG